MVLLGHGGGGSLSQRLIDQLLVPAFGPADGVLLDAAVLPAEAGPLAFTTDSYVVRPLFFPAATSAAWRCLAPSMIWPWWGPARLHSASV
jgi:hydrogenase expression/formation protein HypE